VLQLDLTSLDNKGVFANAYFDYCKRLPFGQDGHNGVHHLFEESGYRVFRYVELGGQLGEVDFGGFLRELPLHAHLNCFA